MSLASEIASELSILGFTCKPWGTGTTQRIYVGNGYIDVIGKFGFRTQGLELKTDIICKAKEIFDKIMADRKANKQEIEIEYDEVIPW